MRHGDNHVLFNNHILNREIRRYGEDLGAAWVGETILDIDQFTLDDLENFYLAGKNFVKSFDHGEKLLVFLNNLVTFEPGKAMQAHFENRLSLDLAQFESSDQS